jgi:hypothetical protein
MEALVSTPKFRSKSSIKFVSKSIRRTSPSEVMTKSFNHTKSVIRVYGRTPGFSRFKSTREAQSITSPSSNLYSPNNKFTLSTVHTPNYSKSVNNSAAISVEKEKLKYDVLKAKSDKLEIMRDFAAYEYNFIQEMGLDETARKAEGFVNQLNEFYDRFKEIGNGGNSLGDKIDSFVGYSWKQKIETERKVFGEKFEVVQIENENSVKEFRGIYRISGVRCQTFVKLYKGKLFSIKCMIENMGLLQIKLTQSEVYWDKSNSENDYKHIINYNIIPRLYIITESTGSKLVYNKYCNIQFNTILTHVKGMNKLHSIMIKDEGDFFEFQVTNTQLSIKIEKKHLSLNSLSTESQSKFQRLISQFLYQYKDILYWGENCFEHKESASRLLKEKYLLDAFNDYLLKIFSIKTKYKGRIIKVEGIECQNKKSLKLSMGKNQIELEENMAEFQLIFGMQSLNFYGDFVTISKSLEMEYIIKSLFDIN